MNVSNINTVGIIGAGLMGHGIAIQFASKGFKVILNDVSKERLETSLKNIESTAEQIENVGRKALPVIADVSSLNDVEKLIDKTLNKFGRIEFFYYFLFLISCAIG